VGKRKGMMVLMRFKGGEKWRKKANVGGSGEEEKWENEIIFTTYAI
jgi:hypothetical protein